MRVIYSLNKCNDGICKRFACSKNILLSHNKNAYVLVECGSKSFSNANKSSLVIIQMQEYVYLYANVYNQSDFIFLQISWYITWRF